MFPDVESYHNTLINEFWTNDPTIISNQSDTSITVLPGLPGDYTYTFNVEDDYGCFYDTVVTVTVVDFPLVDPVVSQTVCDGENFNAIDLTGTATASFSWTNSDSSIGLAATGLGDIAGFQASGGANLISAAVTVTPFIGGCFGPPITFNLNVNPLPAVDAGPDFALCDGSASTVSASGASTYSWDNSLGAGATHPINPGDTITYTVTGTDINGCVNTDQITVNVLPSPTIDAGADTIICLGSNIVLTASGGTTYIWDKNVVDSTSFNPLTTTTYNVTGQNDLGCVGTDQIVVTVVDQPIPVISPSITIGTPTLNVVFSNLSTGANSYTWNLGNGGNDINVNDLSSQSESYSNLGTYTISLTASNGVCSNETTIEVIVINFDPAVISPPNIFTPDGDKSNDWLYVSLLNATDITMQIYNRWGNFMYEIKGIYDKDNPATYWDGLFEGKEANEGVYFYTYSVMGIDGTTTTGQANAQLIRKK